LAQDGIEGLEKLRHDLGLDVDLNDNLTGFKNLSGLINLLRKVFSNRVWEREKQLEALN